MALLKHVVAVALVAAVAVWYQHLQAFFHEPLQGGFVMRLKPEMDTLIPKDAQIEVLASGFSWTEGPAVFVAGDGKEVLLFTDTNTNTIFAWDEEAGMRPWRSPSGRQKRDSEGLPLLEPGANGLLLDPKSGALIVCSHGHRRVETFQAKDTTSGLFGGNIAQPAVIASSFDGKRLNSPNDATLGPSGFLYFTDPSYGLQRMYEKNPGEEAEDRELSFNGVYRVPLSVAGAGGDPQVQLVTDAITHPNGLAFTPTFDKLIVASSSSARPLWHVLSVGGNGTLSEPEIFADATRWSDRIAVLPGGEAINFAGLPDGMIMSTDGHLFAAGPGGVWVFDLSGDVLGMIVTNDKTSNCLLHGGFLYITRNDLLVRIRVNAEASGL